LLVLPLVVFSRDIMALYVGPEFAQASQVMALLLWVLPVAYATLLRPELASVTGKVRTNALRTAAMQIGNLGLTLYLVGILKMGALGSALGTLCASLLFYPLLLWPMSLKLAGLDWSTWLRRAAFPGVAPALPAVAVWVLCRWGLQPQSWVTLIGAALPGLLVYLVALLTVCTEAEDRAYLRQLWRRVLTLSDGLRACRPWLRAP